MGDRLMKSLESRASLGLTQGGEVGIDDGGVQGLVAEVGADLSETDAFFEQMRGVGMA